MILSRESYANLFMLLPELCQDISAKRITSAILSPDRIFQQLHRQLITKNTLFLRNKRPLLGDTVLFYKCNKISNAQMNIILKFVFTLQFFIISVEKNIICHWLS